VIKKVEENVRKNLSCKDCLYCADCQMDFQNKEHEMEHVREQHERLFSCCEQTFTRRGLSIHNGLQHRLVSCETCGKLFQKEMLKRHKNIVYERRRKALSQNLNNTEVHTDDGIVMKLSDFECDQCGHTFLNAPYLKEHMINHEDNLQNVDQMKNMVESYMKVFEYLRIGYMQEK
jgi:DNA-directed RNA polymerase subunit M/transcription elongation factor TFIIS